MKAIDSISTDLFFTPAAAWYEQPRATTRKKATALRLALLENQENKQETACSVILILCMLFSLAVVFAQFAVS